MTVPIATAVTACQARLLVAQGDMVAAARWAERRGLSADDELQPYRELEYIALARLLIAQGRFGAAGRLLGRLLEAAGASGRVGRTIEINLYAKLGVRSRTQALARARERYLLP